jgi:hypothetical protein
MLGKSSERRVWSEGEDRALKQLYEGLQLNRWSLIAQQLELYGYPGRTGKQCRERCFYSNSATIISWTPNYATRNGLWKRKNAYISSMMSLAINGQSSATEWVEAGTNSLIKD